MYIYRGARTSASSVVHRVPTREHRAATLPWRIPRFPLSLAIVYEGFETGHVSPPVRTLERECNHASASTLVQIRHIALEMSRD